MLSNNWSATRHGAGLAVDPLAGVAAVLVDTVVGRITGSDGLSVETSRALAAGNRLALECIVQEKW